jgi:hypothetical protein
MPKILIKPDAEGNIVISKEVLEELGLSPIELRVEEAGVILESKIEKLMNQIAGGEFPIWSPYDADEATAAALEMLKSIKSK